jgi:hypothetical protein
MSLFLFQLALKATAMIDALIHANRESVLIIDDTVIELNDGQVARLVFARVRRKKNG